MHIELEEDLLSFDNINYVNPLVNLVGFNLHEAIFDLCSGIRWNVEAEIQIFNVF